MNPLVFAAMAIGAIGLYLFLRSRVAPEWEIQPGDIPGLISKLESSTTQPAWAQIIAVTQPDNEDSAIALDYLISNGRLEFNWCLLAPQNIEDKSKMIEFFSQHGFTSTEQVAKNGCPLINVSGSNLHTLANRILVEVYQCNGPLRLIGEGFEWP